MIGKLALRLLRGTLWPSVHVTPAPADIIITWNVPVRVRDGKILRVNVFRPQAPGPVPVIMSAHPYGKDKIPAKTWSGRSPNLQARLVPQPHTMRISALTSWEAPDPAFWTEQGYAVVNADLRGLLSRDQPIQSSGAPTTLARSDLPVGRLQRSVSRFRLPRWGPRGWI
jgi:predicted acyl esterase